MDGGAGAQDSKARRGLEHFRVIFTMQMLDEVFYRQLGPSGFWWLNLIWKVLWCLIPFSGGLAQFSGNGEVREQHGGDGKQKQKTRGGNARTGAAWANKLFPEQRLWWRQLSWRLCPVFPLQGQNSPIHGFSLCAMNSSPLWCLEAELGASSRWMEVVEWKNGVDGKVHISIQIMSFSCSIHPLFLIFWEYFKWEHNIHVRALFLSYMCLKVVAEFRNYWQEKKKGLRREGLTCAWSEDPYILFWEERQFCVFFF